MIGRSPSDLPPRIVVVGSINMDLLVKCQRLPQAGETVNGDSICESPGGKGANQAVAAARLGSQVTMVGRIGDDAFSPRLISNLKSERISVKQVRQTEGTASGIAIVLVESSGENAIALVAGANGMLSPEDVRAASNEIEAADVLLLQLETPLETAVAAIAVARASGTLVLLDPAPAPLALPTGLLDVDFVCPNETEAEVLTGMPIETDDQALSAAAQLCKMGARCAVITRGQRGALVFQHDGSHKFVASVPINAVDTTAAGDAFAAAFAVQLSKEEHPFDAARYACLAGASAASRQGAQIAMPSHEDVIGMATTRGRRSNRDEI